MSIYMIVRMGIDDAIVIEYFYPDEKTTTGQISIRPKVEVFMITSSMQFQNKKSLIA